MTVSVIYAGGTIGSIGTPLGPMEATAFRDLWARYAADRIPGDSGLDWTWLAPALDSSAMTPKDWVTLAGSVLDAAAKGHPVVVLHGTDTMAWSTAALSYLTTLMGPDGAAEGRLAAPIVVTGSQLPLFVAGGLWPGTDALDNVAQAIAQADRQATGVRIAFGGEDLAGTRATKVSTLDFKAFHAPNGETPLPPLPAAPPEVLRDQLAALAPHLGEKAVLSYLPTPNMPACHADMLAGATDRLGARLGAVVLQGFGIGNIPGEAEMRPVLGSLHDRGVLLMAASQVWRGAVDPSTYGAGHWLGDVGAIAIGDMVLPAVTAKLHLALALATLHSWDQTATEAFMTTPIAGEIS